MARVVGVHGIGQQQSGGRQLAKDWGPAVQDGLTAAGAPGMLADGDMTVAFYGDLFLPPGQQLSGGEAYLTAADVESGLEQELLALWWAAAAEEPQVVGPDAADTLGGVPGSVQAGLRALSQSRFFARVAERMLVADLRQVRRYLSDPVLRAAARGRVTEAIGPDTVVVVGHSLGSVVAYEALCALDSHRVRALVTLGSPLGIPRLIFDRLDPAPQTGVGRWPGNGQMRWTNVADRRDVVALVKDLRPIFGPGVDCHLVPNGSHAHDATFYLGKQATGAAIAQGLR
ncbi:alpha/beta hydrolase [Streptomyces sp. QTS52]